MKKEQSDTLPYLTNISQCLLPNCDLGLSGPFRFHSACLLTGWLGIDERRHARPRISATCAAPLPGLHTMREFPPPRSLDADCCFQGSFYSSLHPDCAGRFQLGGPGARCTVASCCWPDRSIQVIPTESPG